jgi:prepilin-type processing-associated H-X9-DG protein
MNGAGGDPKTDSGSIKFSSKNGAIDVTNSLKLVFKMKDTQGNHGYKISLVDINGNGTNFAWADGPN